MGEYKKIGNNLGGGEERLIDVGDRFRRGMRREDVEDVGVLL